MTARRSPALAFAAADESGETVTLRQLYVLPSMQGRGVGGMLLDEIEGRSRSQEPGAGGRGGERKAIRFYVAHGFVDTGLSDDLCRHAGINETVRRMERARGT